MRLSLEQLPGREKPSFPYVRRNHPNGRAGFSLVELLVVIAVVGVMAGAMGPALVSLRTAGDVTAGSAKLAGVLDMARTFARANKTVVRVGVHESAPESPDNVITFIVISSATGDLQNSGSADLANDTLWPMIGRPVQVRGLSISDALALTGEESVGTDFGSFTRPVGGADMSFDRQIQFEPQGAVRIAPGTLSRQINIGLASGTQPGNVALIRVAGLSGRTSILRAEDLDSL